MNMNYDEEAILASSTASASADVPSTMNDDDDCVIIGVAEVVQSPAPATTNPRPFQTENPRKRKASSPLSPTSSPASRKLRPHPTSAQIIAAVPAGNPFLEASKTLDSKIAALEKRCNAAAGHTLYHNDFHLIRKEMSSKNKIVANHAKRIFYYFLEIESSNTSYYILERLVGDNHHLVQAEDEEDSAFSSRKRAATGSLMTSLATAWFKTAVAAQSKCIGSMREFLRAGIETLMDKLEEAGNDINLRDLDKQGLIVVLKHYWNDNPLAMASSMFQQVNTQVDFPGMYCKTNPATDLCHAERQKWCNYNLNVFVKMAYATFVIFLSREAEQGNDSAASQNQHWRFKLFKTLKPIHDEFGIGSYAELPVRRG